MKKVAFIFNLFFAFYSLGTRAQIITTIAGNGVSGFSGDGGLGTAAQLSSCWEIALDGVGNLYISDYSNHVRKLNTSGIISTVVGIGTFSYSGDGGAAIAAEINRPFGLAVDSLGNIYIGDMNNNRIRKVSSSGIISTIAGNGTAGYSGDGGPATSAQLRWPACVAVDGAGNVYFVDSNNHCVRKINTSGIITTIAGTGFAGYNGDGGVATAAKLNLPQGLALDKTGNIYIADGFNNRIRKVNTSGIISTIVGNGSAGFSGDGGAATSAQLNYAAGIKLDRIGNIYIADFYNQRIRKVNTSGIITTVAGNGVAGFSGDGGLATSAQLNYPDDVSVDGAGNIFIADMNNHRIRKVTLITGETELKNVTEINIYPIPCNDLMKVNLSGDGYKEIKLVDALGKEVFSQRLNQTEQNMALEINTGEIPVGIYRIQISMANETLNKNVLIQR